ncbi:hypothetical protein EYF80_068376 [Liparis tanakae]|uniref:Uncharacterized protein n=1 Tax=Liparis tanakae TaxID=230148 RepID=A0A4Z2DY70_9TELE|nr:hypothetical protein EYF80_068376 [Liparis tanakae]
MRTFIFIFTFIWLLVFVRGGVLSFRPFVSRDHAQQVGPGAPPGPDCGPVLCEEALMRGPPAPPGPSRSV